jgi:hypothetical protein
MVVNSPLDTDGRLHLDERQSMVFNGNWNGGARRKISNRPCTRFQLWHPKKESCHEGKIYTKDVFADRLGLARRIYVSSA